MTGVSLQMFKSVVDEITILPNEILVLTLDTLLDNTSLQVAISITWNLKTKALIHS